MWEKPICILLNILYSIAYIIYYTDSVSAIYIIPDILILSLKAMILLGFLACEISICSYFIMDHLLRLLDEDGKRIEYRRIVRDLILAAS